MVRKALGGCLGVFGGAPGEILDPLRTQGPPRPAKVGSQTHPGTLCGGHVGAQVGLMLGICARSF